MKKHDPVDQGTLAYKSGKFTLDTLIAERAAQGLPTDMDALRTVLRRRMDGLPDEVPSQPAPSQPELEFDLETLSEEIDPDEFLEAPLPYLQYEVFTAIPSPNSPDLKTRDAETNRRISETVSRLHRSGSRRKIMRPDLQWRTQLAVLQADFPNFSEVIQDAIAPYLALLATCRSMPPRFTPILLEGPPGIGKTRFMHEVAKLLNANLLLVDMASQTNGATLAGSSVFWANSAPGSLFNGLAWGPPGAQVKATGGLLTVLDELDKVPFDTEGQFNPTGALYRLLEESTACQFEDAALPGIVIDASKVAFCICVNSSARIPAPILSRVQHFHIDAPSANQVRGVLKRIYLDVLSRIDVDFSHHLPEEVIDAAQELSPRVAKLRFQVCIGKAVAANRDCIDLDFWTAAESAQSQKKQPMGFY